MQRAAPAPSYTRDALVSVKRCWASRVIDDSHWSRANGNDALAQHAPMASHVALTNWFTKSSAETTFDDPAPGVDLPLHPSPSTSQVKMEKKNRRILPR